MNILKEAIYQQAIKLPQKIAIQGDDIALDYSALVTEIEMVSELLKFTQNEQRSTYAFLIDNHPAWAVLDLTLLFYRQCAVPLPRFFSIEQLKHAISDSHAERLVLDDSKINMQLLDELQDLLSAQEKIIIAGKTLHVLHLNHHVVSPENDNIMNNNIVKITYTSGTTDKPKGVLLSEQAIVTKIVSLKAASEANSDDISLSVLPLSTLLENIGGLYVPLFCGATAIILSPETIGLSGSSQVNHERLLSSLKNCRPTAFIIIPQLLLLLVNALSKGFQLPDSIRFIAMGGAPVSRNILELARQLKIPVFEGYGLSEAVSVVAVNNPSENRPGSVGKVLDAHELKITETGEILVKNHLFSGYLGAEPTGSGFYATGDIGHLDDDGYLYITGRKKNVMNTSFGRNISPEWIEKELEAIPAIAQAVIYGHAKPYLIAIIVPRIAEGAGTEEVNSIISNIRQSLTELNAQLPDYARLLDVIFADEPFSIVNNQLTGTSRPRRAAIYQAYEYQLERSYEQSQFNENNLNGELCE